MNDNDLIVIKNKIYKRFSTNKANFRQARPLPKHLSVLLTIAKRFWTSGYKSGGKYR